MTERTPPFFRYLSDNGQVNGAKEMATTPNEYFFLAIAPSIISQMLITYQDEGEGMAQEYGNLGIPLANGLTVKHIAKNGTTVVNDLTDGEPVKINAHWPRLCYDNHVLNYGPAVAGEDSFAALWIFVNAGQPLFLQPGERLSMFIDDDLSELTEHHAIIQGYSEPTF